MTKIQHSVRIRTDLSLKFPVYRETNGQIARCTCSMGDRKQELFGHQGELNHHVISSLKRVHDEIYRRFSRVHQYTTVHSVTGYSKLRGGVDRIQNERTQTLILCNARPWASTMSWDVRHKQNSAISRGINKLLLWLRSGSVWSEYKGLEP